MRTLRSPATTQCSGGGSDGNGPKNAGGATKGCDRLGGELDTGLCLGSRLRAFWGRFGFRPLSLLYSVSPRFKARVVVPDTNTLSVVGTTNGVPIVSKS